MSKRKNRESLPSETLERARQQAESAAGSSAQPEAEKRRRRPTTPMNSGTVRTTSRRERKIEEMSMEQIEQLLHNPTKVVSEAELRQQYGYVLTDLRNMGVLAAALFIALIAVSLVLF